MSNNGSFLESLHSQFYLQRGDDVLTKDSNISNKKGVSIFFFTRMYPEAKGGAEIFAYRIASSLAKRRHSVRILSLSGNQDIYTFYSRLDILNVCRYPGFLNHFLMRLPIAISFAIVSELFSKSKTILCFSSHSLIFGYPICRVLGKRCVVRLIGSDLHSLEQKAHSMSEIYDKFSFKLGFRFLSHSDAVIVMSTWMKEYLTRKGVTDKKIQLIPNGLDVSLISPKIEREGRPIRLVYVGRFSKGMGADKRVTMLIDVFKKFVTIYPDSRLILVGDGPGGRMLFRKLLI